MLRPRTPRRRGAATVELAVTLAFFVLPIFLGLWEVSCIVEAKQLLANACREAGRQASAGTRSKSEVEQVVKNYLTQNGVNASRVTVTMTNMTSSSRSDPQTAQQMDRFHFHAKIPYADLRTSGTSVIQILSVAEVEAKADWFSMRDSPVSVDGSVPIE
jgi:Flp pilus assembly protein TadG